MGQSVSMFGTKTTTVALPIVALVTLDASTFEVGLITASGVVAWLILSLPAGAWTDRTSRRTILIACDLIRAAALLTVPALAAFNALSVPHLVIVALVIGTGAVFADISSQAFLPSLAGKEKLATANGRLQASGAVAQTAGPSLGGGLVQLLTAPIALIFDVGSYIFSAACLLAIKRDELQRNADRKSVVEQMREGLSYVWRDPVIRPLTLVTAGVNFLGVAFDVLLTPFLLRTVGISPGLLGALLAVGGLGGLTGSIIGPRLAKKTGPAKTLLCMAVVGPVVTLIVPWTVTGAGLILFCVGIAVREACIAAFSLLGRTYRQATAPPQLLGRITATTRFLSWGVLPLGALFGGILGNLLGNRAGLLVVCILLLLTPIPAILSEIRRNPKILQTVSRSASPPHTR